MTTAGHTPGPWTYNCGDDGAVVYKEAVGTIANVPDDLTSSEANARLIAAAPDLLQAAERALQALQDNYDKYSNCQWHDADSRDAYIALRDAVSLAKGGSI